MNYSPSSLPSGNGQGARKTISALHISKARKTYFKHQRVVDAAGWVRGEVRVAPTLKLAAAVFGVPLAEIRRLVRWRKQHDLGKQSNGGTTALSDTAIDNIVMEIGPERFLQSIDRLTQPKLPLVAAE